MIKVTLFMDDIEPEHSPLVLLRDVRFKHLTADAQRVVLLAGRATLRCGDSYEAIYPPRGR